MLVLVDCDFMIYYCYICIIFEKILHARRVFEDGNRYRSRGRGMDRDIDGELASWMETFFVVCLDFNRLWF